MRTNAYIDASNLFYGGKKSLGWSIDTEQKANCDVDMAFYMMRDKNAYDRAIFLSGDGDFLPVLKHLKENKKEIMVLSRSPRTALEIKQFAGDKLLDFEYLREILKFEEKK